VGDAAVERVRRKIAAPSAVLGPRAVLLGMEQGETTAPPP